MTFYLTYLSHRGVYGKVGAAADSRGRELRDRFCKCKWSRERASHGGKLWTHTSSNCMQAVLTLVCLNTVHGAFVYLEEIFNKKTYFYKKLSTLTHTDVHPPARLNFPMAPQIEAPTRDLAFKFISLWRTASIQSIIKIKCSMSLLPFNPVSPWNHTIIANCLIQSGEFLLSLPERVFCLNRMQAGKKKKEISSSLPK